MGCTDGWALLQEIPGIWTIGIFWDDVIGQVVPNQGGLYQGGLYQGGLYQGGLYQGGLYQGGL